METEGLSNQSSSTKLIGGMNIPHFFLLSSPPNHGLLLLLDYFHLCRNLLTTFLPTRQQGCVWQRETRGGQITVIIIIVNFPFRCPIAHCCESRSNNTKKSEPNRSSMDNFLATEYENGLWALEWAGRKGCWIYARYEATLMGFGECSIQLETH